MQRLVYPNLPGPFSRRHFVVAAAMAALFPRRAQAASCGTATSAASQGPYWRPNAPTGNDLRRTPQEPGLVVRGRLLDARTCAPLAGRLEVWQADHMGRYDVDYGDGAQFGRASLTTKADGTYEFTTIRPAGYGSGQWRRPAHIHFIVSAGGQRRLVTQHYFAGDPNLGSDPLRDVHEDLIATPRPVTGRPGVVEECTFDVKL